MPNKTINVNELQAKISSIIKEAQSGVTFEVMRYSEPVAVVLSYADYLKLKGECKYCIQELKSIAGIIKSKESEKK